MDKVSAESVTAASRGCSQIMSAAEGLRGWKRLTLADKGVGGVRQMLTLAVQGGLVNAEITDKMPKNC